MAKIGRYEIIEELGRGAMGVVFKARDPQIGRLVAIKVILTANLSGEDLQHYKARFMREAQAAGQMSHPGIVTIHDINEDDQGQPYLVMEYIEGQTLEKMLSLAKAAPAGEKTDSGLDLPPPAPRLLVGHSLDIGAQLADALDYAHRRGVIHRDIKPSNIIITSDGRAKIADFGIAKTADSAMTQTNQRMGTPAFMSPEQVSGTPVDSRSDIFSLGSVLYWMFTGEKPFPGESITTIVYKVVFSTPLPASYINRALPAEVDLVLGRCLAKNANDRYAAAKEAADDLRAVKEGRPVKATAAPAADVTVVLDDKSPAANIVAGLPADQKAVLAAGPLPADHETLKMGSRPSAAPPPPPAPDAPAPAPAGDDLILTVEAKPTRDQTAQSVPTPQPKPRPVPPAPSAAASPPSKPVVAEQLEIPAVPAPAVASSPEPEKKKSSLVPVMVLGLVAVVAVGYFLWTKNRTHPQPDTPPAPVTQAPSPQTTPGSSPSDSGTQPAPTGAAIEPARQPVSPPKAPVKAGSVPGTYTAAKTPAASPAPKTGAPSASSPVVRTAARSTLLLDVRHNFKAASIAVMVGNATVYQGLLQEKQKRVQFPVEIPAGERVVRVRVQSDTPKFDQEREVGGTFSAGMARPLTVEFGRGSGAGLTDRKLTLTLGNPTAAPAKKP